MDVPHDKLRKNCTNAMSKRVKIDELSGEIKNSKNDSFSHDKQSEKINELEIFEFTTDEENGKYLNLQL